MEPVIPDLGGATVLKATIDWGLHVWTDDNWEFVIEQPVRVTSCASGGDGVEMPVVVEARALPAPVSDIVGQRILRTRVTASGSLSIELDSLEITVRPCADYEAWHLGGPHGELFVCTPGGAITCFAPLPRNR